MLAKIRLFFEKLFGLNGVSKNPVTNQTPVIDPSLPTTPVVVGVDKQNTDKVNI